MARLLDDPICYCLEFSCVTDEFTELFLKQVFIHIVREAYPMLKPFMKEVGIPCDFTRRDNEQKYRSVRISAQSI